MNRVVITGMGIVSSIGIGKEEVTSSLRSGKCGIVLDESRSGFRSALTGYIPKLPSTGKNFAPQTVYMYHAIKEAISDDINTNCGLIIGNDGSSRANKESIFKFEATKATSKLGSTHLFKSLTSNPTAVLSNQFGFSGTSFTISGACASGGHAIGTAYNLIRCGQEHTIVCGGCQEINQEATFAFDALRSFSTSNNPEEAVRPFDKERDGLVPSGGAACLVLEEYEHAIERGATIYAEILGYGATSSCLLSASSAYSEYKCMRKALGSLCPDEVDLVSAHATGTKDGDDAEALALAQLFPNRVPIIATKTLTGHEMWAAGASEIIYAILSAKAGFLPPNRNSKDCPYDLNLNTETLELKEPIRYILSNSFGLGGTNSSILLKI